MEKLLEFCKGKVVENINKDKQHVLIKFSDGSRVWIRENDNIFDACDGKILFNAIIGR